MRHPVSVRLIKDGIRNAVCPLAKTARSIFKQAPPSLGSAVMQPPTEKSGRARRAGPKGRFVMNATRPRNAQRLIGAGPLFAVLVGCGKGGIKTPVTRTWREHIPQSRSGPTSGEYCPWTCLWLPCWLTQIGVACATVLRDSRAKGKANALPLLSAPPPWGPSVTVREAPSTCGPVSESPYSVVSSPPPPGVDPVPVCGAPSPWGPDGGPFPFGAPLTVRGAPSPCGPVLGPYPFPPSLFPLTLSLPSLSF